ncbi:hypothetical protein SpiGrapes_0754 [Sphaerochaeta pleomorpha str. Grapes]|uniref:Uncharacterized protein n=1 Tax=Sphaerochaeta pleomorpha (strain ATCC BAA-1885 / DSM 22778 / Grapes) TaxID=158190 RepID=G8QYM6_SPHPG|nr:hypothetical protein [Sphaerochaeta pleomorpha]AEV28589.1 hypothetical protein SpiGrapes_0754 [Sphaerochaeta pleomorpha str. Grapes]
MKIIRPLSIGLHIFLGVGAMSGGFACLIDTQTPLGTSVEMLQNSPFTSFLIPGLLLFFVIGVGNIIGSILVKRSWEYWGYSSGILGGALVIWIIVQCLMLNAVVFLHVLFFFLGIFQVSLAMGRLYEQNQFPGNLLTVFLQKKSKNSHI